jgi:hypothetical protein
LPVFPLAELARPSYRPSSRTLRILPVVFWVFRFGYAANRTSPDPP